MSRVEYDVVSSRSTPYAMHNTACYYSCPFTFTLSFLSQGHTYPAHLNHDAIHVLSCLVNKTKEWNP